MTIPDALEASAYFGLVVFLFLCFVSAVSLRWKRHRGLTVRERLPVFGRYAMIRVGIAVGLAGALFAVMVAAITLNSHRPPGDVTPVVKVAKTHQRAVVSLHMEECGQPVTGRVRVRGARPARDRVSVYSDQDGHRTFKLDRHGEATFTFSDPTATRGVFSCYLQLPIVRGGTGTSTVKLSLGSEMEVDAFASVPAPGSYFSNHWIWKCPANQTCPGLATAGLAIEEGAKQVIVLVLAAVFGAIIALLIGELLIEPLRRRLDKLSDSRRSS